MKYLTSGRILFALLFVVLFAILIVTAMGYNPRARTFPLIVAIPVFLGAIGNLIWDVRAVQRGEKPAKVEADAKPAAEKKKKEKLIGRARTKRELIGIAWLIGYVIAVALIGFPIATIGYLIAFIRLYNRESWKLALIYTAIMWGFIWVAFVFFLKSTLYPGLIFEWLGL